MIIILRSIMKSYKNAMRSTSISSCIMTIISNFVRFLSFKYLLSRFSLLIKQILLFHLSRAALLLIISFHLIILIACSLNDLRNFFIQSLSLYTSFLLSMLLRDDIVDIEKPDGICLPAFLCMSSQDYFYIHQSFLLNIQGQHK